MPRSLKGMIVLMALFSLTCDFANRLWAQSEAAPSTPDLCAFCQIFLPQRALDGGVAIHSKILLDVETVYTGVSRERDGRTSEGVTIDAETIEPMAPHV